MIKKIVFFIGVILFGYSDTYFYSIKMDYKEYLKGNVIDKDYTKLGDLNGIGYKFVNENHFINYGGYIEFAYGNSYYKGATWSGIPLQNKQKNVYILNFEAFLGRNFNLVIGYREWNRGKSNNEGDYDEIYYWGYWGIKYRYKFFFKKFAFFPEITYQLAINPKLKIKLGNNPTLKLGQTDGGKIDLPLFVKYKQFVFKIFYRYQYWHINPSDIYKIIINNQTIYIYEPESLTINQYFGIGFLYKF